MIWNIYLLLRFFFFFCLYSPGGSQWIHGGEPKILTYVIPKLSCRRAQPHFNLPAPHKSSETEPATMLQDVSGLSLVF